MPESLVFFPATSPLPLSVSTNLYVASSLISSVTAPSVALPPPPSAPPTGRNHPLQVPTSSRGTKERDTSDCVRLATASWGPLRGTAGVEDDQGGGGKERDNLALDH